MDISTNPARGRAGLTYEITAAELSAANSGQRNDILALKDAFFRTPDQALYGVSDSQLVPTTPGGGGGGGGDVTQGEFDTAIAGLQTQIDNAAIAYDPVTLSGAGPHLLNAADHANRLLICNHSSSMTLTLQTDAAGGFAKDDSINAVQYGAGDVTIIAGGATLRAGGISTTTAQYTLVGSVRIGANEWALTEKTASSGVTAKAATCSVSGLWSVDDANATQVNQVGARQVRVGTAEARGLSTTNAVTKTLRIAHAGAASAGSECGMEMGSQNFYFDHLPYKSRIVFAVDDSIASGTRQAHGVTSLAIDHVNNQPNADYLLNRAFLAARSTDANFIFVHNDDGITPVVTTIGGGSGFPCNDPTKLYDFTLEYYPTGPRRIVFELKNLTDNTTSGEITILTRLPVPTAQMRSTNLRNSVANVAAAKLSFVRLGFGALA